jgi:hypothetical protein
MAEAPLTKKMGWGAMNTTVKIAFPDLDDADANEQAESLLSELKQDPKLLGKLERTETAVLRTDREAMDFGATLAVVLGTPAVIPRSRR